MIIRNTNAATPLTSVPNLVLRLEPLASGTNSSYRDATAPEERRATIPFPQNPFLAETVDYCPGSSSDTAVPLEIIGEKIIGGKFKVVSYLESGGIADIFIVSDETGKEYAAKILKPTGKQDYLKRILRESEIMLLLSGKPNILEFIALGHIDVRPIIVLEFANEGSLYAKAKKGNLTFKEGVTYLRDALSGLASMHELGLIHRDIKPQNILISGDEAKLSDFDLTMSMGDDLYTSVENGISGTVNYIAPEQIREDKIDFKSDVYSFGATAYHIFTGRLPFIGNTINEVVGKHLNETPPYLRTFNECIPSELEAVILKSLSKDPNERPTALEFKAVLDALLANDTLIPDIRLKLNN